MVPRVLGLCGSEERVRGKQTTEGILMWLCKEGTRRGSLREAALAWGQREDKSSKYRGLDIEVAG